MADIIELMLKIGLKASRKGVCYGLEAMASMAFIQGPQAFATFEKRLQLIDQLDLSAQALNIELDTQIFLENVALHQAPMEHLELFEPKSKLSQNSVRTAQIMQSIEMERLGGLICMPTIDLNPDPSCDLKNSLTHLRSLSCFIADLKNFDSKRFGACTISIGNDKHVIMLGYNAYSETWHLSNHGISFKSKNLLSMINEINRIFPKPRKPLTIILKTSLSTAHEFYHPLRLHTSLCKGNNELVKSLIWACANPNLIDGRGNSVLFYAIIQGNLEIIDVLKKCRVCLNPHNGTLEAILSAASSFNDLPAVRGALYAGANPNTENLLCKTPLSYALENKNIDMLKVLLRAGVDPNKKVDGVTPLYSATYSMQEEAVDELILKGADPNIADRDGYTPLHYAVLKQSLPIVNRLLKAGANVNTQANSGVTPLMVAIGRKNTAIMAALLGAGATLHIKKPDGNSCLDLVLDAQNNALIDSMFLNPNDEQWHDLSERLFDALDSELPNQYFIDKFKDPSLTYAKKFALITRAFEKGHHDFALNLAQAYDMAPKIKFNDGYLLTLAIKYNHSSLVDQLLKPATEARAYDYDSIGYGAFNQAVLVSASDPDKKKYLEKLLTLTYKPSIGGWKADNGDSPLHLTLKKGAAESTRLLCKAGASIFDKNNMRVSALDLAIRCENYEMIEAVVDNVSRDQQDRVIDCLENQLKGNASPYRFASVVLTKLSTSLSDRNRDKLKSGLLNWLTDKLNKKGDVALNALITLMKKNPDIFHHDRADNLNFTLENRLHRELKERTPNSTLVHVILMHLHSQHYSLKTPFNKAQYHACRALTDRCSDPRVVGFLRNELIKNLKNTTENYSAAAVRNTGFFYSQQDKRRNHDTFKYMLHLDLLLEGQCDREIFDTIKKESVAFLTGGISVINNNHTYHKPRYFGKNPRVLHFINDKNLYLDVNDHQTEYVANQAPR